MEQIARITRRRPSISEMSESVAKYLAEEEKLDGPFRRTRSKYINDNSLSETNPSRFITPEGEIESPIFEPHPPPAIESINSPPIVELRLNAADKEFVEDAHVDTQFFATPPAEEYQAVMYTEEDGAVGGVDPLELTDEVQDLINWVGSSFQNVREVSQLPDVSTDGVDLSVGCNEEVRTEVPLEIITLTDEIPTKEVSVNKRRKTNDVEILSVIQMEPPVQQIQARVVAGARVNTTLNSQGLQVIDAEDMNWYRRQAPIRPDYNRFHVAQAGIPVTQIFRVEQRPRIIECFGTHEAPLGKRYMPSFLMQKESIYWDIAKRYPNPICSFITRDVISNYDRAPMRIRHYHNGRIMVERFGVTAVVQYGRGEGIHYYPVEYPKMIRNTSGRSRREFCVPTTSIPKNSPYWMDLFRNLKIPAYNSIKRFCHSFIDGIDCLVAIDQNGRIEVSRNGQMIELQLPMN